MDLSPYVYVNTYFKCCSRSEEDSFVFYCSHMKPDKKLHRTVSFIYVDGFTQGTELDERLLINISIMILQEREVPIMS